MRPEPPTPSALAMPIRRRRGPGIWLGSGLLLLLAFAPPAIRAAADLRVLIDVSGSMRQNDPDNLRMPALRLVAQLLPAGATAGIWLFAETVEELEPPGAVDDAWRARVLARLGRIHARGRFTDIEQAVQRATAGWDRPAGQDERHLLLLTDGLVDLSNGAAASAASRARLLDERLASLTGAGAKLHAIGLSGDADTELLTQLTDRTGGWLEAARDAETLQRIFLHMLEQTAAPTTVPLVDNGFAIDAGIREFTVLAFRDGDLATALIAPDGTRIQSGQTPGTVQWRNEPGYDLVTIATPAPGGWRIEGPSDPDNRVVVVTDLGLEIGPLPNVLLAGETLRIEAWATEQGRPLGRLDFLELLAASGTLAPVSEDPAVSADPGAALELPLDRVTLRYRTEHATADLASGVHQLTVQLDGGTFQREARKRIRVAGAPVTVAYAPRLPAGDTDPAALIATLTVEEEHVDPGSFFGYVQLRGPDERVALAEIGALTGNPMILQVPVAMPGNYEVITRLTARTRDGAPLLLNGQPESIAFEFDPPPPAPGGGSDPDGISWPDLALYLLAGNGVLALLLGLTWVLLRTRPPSGAKPAKPAKPAKKGARP